MAFTTNEKKKKIKTVDFRQYQRVHHSDMFEMRSRTDKIKRHTTCIFNFYSVCM